MAETGINEELDRLRELARNVRNVVLTERYGLAPRTLYRLLTPGYYPTKRLDPEVERQIRDAVEGLEAEFGHDVPRGTVRDDPGRSRAFNLIGRMEHPTATRRAEGELHYGDLAAGGLVEAREDRYDVGELTTFTEWVVEKLRESERRRLELQSQLRRLHEDAQSHSAGGT